MSKELMDALDLLEKEKNISKDSLFDAIENSLITACKNNFGKAENIRVEVDRNNCDFKCYADKEVVELADDVMDPQIEICLDDAKKITKKAKIGDIVAVPRSCRVQQRSEQVQITIRSCMRPEI